MEFRERKTISKRGKRKHTNSLWNGNRFVKMKGARRQKERDY